MNSTVQWLGIICATAPVLIIMPMALIVIPHLRWRHFNYAKQHVSDGTQAVTLEIIQPNRRGRCQMVDGKVNFRALNDSGTVLQRGTTVTVTGIIEAPPDERGFIVTTG